ADRLFGDLDDDLLPFAQKIGNHGTRKAVGRAGQRRTRAGDRRTRTGGRRRLLSLFISLFIAPLFDPQGRLRRPGGAGAVSGAAAASTATSRGHFTSARTLTNSCDRVSQFIHYTPFLLTVLFRPLGRCFKRRLG